MSKGVKRIFLKKASPELERLIQLEEKRQKETIDLIPSENFVSQAVLEASGSVLDNKYSEGYPGKRYYQGNRYYDEIERLCQEKAKKVFGLGNSWHVNVQPYSGSPANLAIYFALLEFGDTMMGMILSHGGHLTHGHKVNFSGKAYKVIQYGVNENTGRIDYAEIEKLAKKHRPKIIISGATAYPRKIDFKKFHQIAKKVGAFSLADISHVAGLVAAGLHPSPFPFTDVVMTTTHKTLRGPRSAVIFCKEKFAEAINKAVFPGMQGGPHMHTIAAKLVCFEEALKPEFKKYQKLVIKNAGVLAAALKRYGFTLVSGGTDNHLILVDLRNKKISGSEAAKLLEEANIVTNKNTIPGDKSPFNPSGIRIGTPAVSSRGMGAVEMEKIASWINMVVDNGNNIDKVRKEVLKTTKNFPVPGLDL